MNSDGDNIDHREGTGDAGDGQFASGAESDFDAWLAEHPQDEGGLTDLWRLRHLSQSLSPREPDEVAWNAVLARIHKSIGHVRSPRPLWTIAAGAAAAAVLALLLARSLWTTKALVPAPTQHVEEPLPVAESGDVTIITIDARDVAALVVGEPPVSGDLEFARPEDIHVIRCERCPHSGRWARLEQGGEVPMFVTAAAIEPPNDD
jgi:hypothetical protein